jgi:hypothetical protein
MGNHDVGRAFAGGADLFWAAITPGTEPTKELALKCLEAIGERYRGADAEFDDELWDQKTALGRMVALAFDAKPEELVRDDDESDECGKAWDDGPCTRFRKHFDFC